MSQTLTSAEKNAIHALVLLNSNKHFYSLDTFPVINEELVYVPLDNKRVQPFCIHIFTVKNYDNPSENDYILPVVCLKDLPFFNFKPSILTQKHDSFYIDTNIVLTASGLYKLLYCQNSKTKALFINLIIIMNGYNNNLSFVEKYVFSPLS
jgi:hypothetical protein